MNLALETVPPSRPLGLDISRFPPVGGSPVVGRVEPRSGGAPVTVDTRLVNHGRLQRPIWVRCEYPNRGEVVAVFEQAGIAMSGDSVEDAISGLMVEIFDAFEDYSTEEASLGPGPRQQLRVLRETSSSGHDRVRVRLRGQLVASFGIRRGSKSLQGHIPHALGLSASEAQQLARCQMSKGQYLKRLEEQGKLDPVS